MKIDCDVARDLMPLVVDGTASMKSCAMVDEHVGTCDACREMLEEMRQEVEAGVPKGDAGPLVKKLRQRRRLRRAMLILLGMALCVVLTLVGWRGWNYYFNDFCVLAEEDSYSITLFTQNIYGVGDITTFLDGNKQCGNVYFDRKTGDMYLWNTTTRLPWPAKSVTNVYIHGDLYYFDDIGYAQLILVDQDEDGEWRYDVMPVNRVLKGAPEWFTGSDGHYKVMVENENLLDDEAMEALKEKWRSRLSAWEVNIKFVWETE